MSRHPRAPFGRLLVAAAALLLAGFTSPPAAAAVPGGSSELPSAERLAELAARAAAEAWEPYRELLSLPSDANIPEHIPPNVAWMRSAFESRGFAVQRLETPGAPLLLARRSGEGGGAAGGKRHTVLIYLQVDGQPVDPSRWDQQDPWKPVLKEPAEGDAWREIPWQRLEGGEVDPDWRVFARAAADAKGPVVAFLAALDAFAETGAPQSYDLKVIMDFEEELGSPNLPAAVQEHREALAADMLLIFDGPRHATNRPTLYFGARGIATATLTVFGPRVPQHSGHYGNYAPNPAVRLAQLLASMKDEEGRVTLPGYYDGVEIDPATREILGRIPDDEEEIRQRLGIARPEAVGATYQEALQYPSLNVRGMASAWVGPDKRTIVPASATAEIDIRLVPEVSAERLIGLLREHVESRGYHLLPGREPTDEERLRYPRLASFTSYVAYDAFRTPYDSEVGQWLNAALLRAFGEEPIRIRMVGGSIPISPFVVTLGVPAVGVPIVQLDNNQHSPNENLRVGNFVDGVRTYLAVLTQPFEAGP